MLPVLFQDIVILSEYNILYLSLTAKSERLSFESFILIYCLHQILWLTARLKYCRPPE